MVPPGPGPFFPPSSCFLSGLFFPLSFFFFLQFGLSGASRRGCCPFFFFNYRVPPFSPPRIPLLFFARVDFLLWIFSVTFLPRGETFTYVQLFSFTRDVFSQDFSFQLPPLSPFLSNPYGQVSTHCGAPDH